MRKEIKRIEKILGFALPFDGLLTIAFNRPVIDVVKFDSIMCDRYDIEGSLADFIKDHFGQNILNSIMRLI